MSNTPHARVRSVLRKAGDLGIDLGQPARLDDPAEFALARKIADWPRQIDIAASGHEPHRIAFCLYELASDFHTLWNRAMTGPNFALFRTIALPQQEKSCWRRRQALSFPQVLVFWG